MRVGDYCRRSVEIIESNAGMAEAARAMREAHVGFLIVVEPGDGKRRPVGVLTDRDIIVQVLARQIDPGSVTVADVMSRKPIVAQESDDLNEATNGMRIAGIRRLPVLSNDGALVGVLALDDVLEIIAGLACDVCGAVRSEQHQERRVRVD